MNFRVKKGKGVKGEITIPGDKSISHRSIMCSSLAEGKSKIYGFLEAEDCLATKLAFQDMGINFEKNKDYHMGKVTSVQSESVESEPVQSEQVEMEVA